MIELTVNGQVRQPNLEPDTPLLWALRDTPGLTGTKYGCGIGEPGVLPAAANAVAALTGQRIRTLPLSKTQFGAV